MRGLFSVFVFAAVFSPFGCQTGGNQQKPAAGAHAPLKSELKKFEAKKCANDSACVTMSVTYPVLTGGDAQMTEKIAAQIAETYRGMLDFENSYKTAPFQATLDSVAGALGNSMKEMLGEVPGAMPHDWSLNAHGNVPVLNNRIITVDVDCDSYLGGAHPNYFSSVITYDLATAKALTAADLLTDTSAVLPMLEKAYREDKNLNPEESIADLLFEDTGGKLPLPKNVAVEPKGIRFLYNDYEVAPHAVGPADLLLTWEQLGALADKKKWLE